MCDEPFARLLYSVDVSFSRRTRSPLSGLVFCLTLVGAVGAQAPTVPGAVATGTAAAPTGPELQFFPLSEVRRGLRGTAYTVFEGATPEPMAVEILGVLKDAIGPKQDMILARLHGQKPEYTGVVAGMSGSPVYVDGKLLGALSFRIGQFSKEPIAGITPIGEMLEVRDGVARPEALPDSASQTASGWQAGASRAGDEVQAMETPLVFSGFSREAVERFADRFTALGFQPVAGLGGSDPGRLQPEPLVPGSAVSAVLVQGDLSIAGTCTVTYVDPERLLACGHPITQYGPVSMPMTKADVVATLPSPMNAFKIVNTTETVGAFTEDRESAILGRFGQTARMIPVTVELQPTGAAATKRTYHFSVLDNRQLTPSAVLVSVYQTLQGTNLSAAEMSYRLHGTLTVERAADGVALPAIRMDGVMPQTEFNPAAITVALAVNERFSRVYESAAEQPRVTGLQLQVESLAGQRSAVLESAQAGSAEVHAGDLLEISGTLDPFRESAQTVHLRVRLPDTVSRGPLRLLVSDGATLDRLAAAPASAQRTASLADTVTRLNALHDNDRVYVTVLDHEAQAVLGSGALGDVPLSMANVFLPAKEERPVQLNGESLLTIGSERTDYAVSGAQVVELLVR